MRWISVLAWFMAGEMIVAAAIVHWYDASAASTFLCVLAAAGCFWNAADRGRR